MASFTQELFGLYKAARINSGIAIPDTSVVAQEWQRYLAEHSEQEGREESIGRAYDGAVARCVRIESKAVGLLTVISIGFAVVAIVLTHPSVVERVFSGVSLLYLVLATCGVVTVLRTKGQPQVLADTARSDSPLASTAAAARALEVQSIQTSNCLVGAIHDLAIAGTSAGIALVLTVFGIS